MSSRAHFWLRFAGVVAILLTQFGPRLWASASAGPSVKVAATDSR